MQDFETAEVILDKLLKRFPNKAEVIVELAYLYYKLDKVKKAEETVKIAERKDSNYYKLYHVKGLLEERKGNRQKAIKDFKKVIKLNPDFYDVRIDLGNLYYRMAEFTKAGNEYQKVLSRKSAHLVATYNLGVIFQKTDKYKEAISRFRKVGGELDEYPQYHFQLGKCYYYLKNYSKAVIHMKKAMDMELKVIYVWGLANIYEKLMKIVPGKKVSYKDKALKLFKLCMENTENNKISLMARKAILKLSPREKLLYTYRLPIDVQYLPIMSGDYSYFYSDKKEAFYKIEKESEDVVWKYKEPAPPSCQYAMGKYFYCGLEDGTIKAIDKNTGKLAWKYKEYVTELKSVDDAILVIRGKNDRLIYIKDGDTEWKFNLDKKKDHNIVTKDNDLLYYNSSYLVRINPKSGKQMWKYDLTKVKGKIKKANISEKYIFVNIKDRKNSLLAIEKDSGKKLWNKEIPGDLKAPPLVYVNKVICLLKKGIIYTLFEDGSQAWKKKYKEDISSGLISGNKLYVCFEDDKIRGLQMKDGKSIWTYQMPKIKKDKVFMIYYVQ